MGRWSRVERRGSRGQALVEAWGKSGLFVEKINAGRDGTRSNMVDGWAGVTRWIFRPRFKAWWWERWQPRSAWTAEL